MPFFRRPRSVRHLVAAWGAYWLGLALVALGRPALEVLRMSRRADAHGNVSAGFEDSIVSLSVVVDGATRWAGAASLPAITFWLVGPPLLLWVAWLLLSRRDPRPDDAIRAAPAPAALGAPAPPAPPAPHVARDRVAVERPDARR